MPQAVAYAFAYIGWTTTTAIVVANIIGTILINIALGAIEFRDDAGELWVAVDD